MRFGAFSSRPMRPIGYEYLRQRLNTGAWPLARPAAVFPVTKVTPMADYLQVPAPGRTRQ